MKRTHEIKPGNYYLFESLSSANSSFFESEEEIDIFKRLMNRYMSKYLEIHRMFIDRTGYQVLVRVRQRRTLRMNYKIRCEERDKEVKKSLLETPWKIVSEMMRIFKSLYVRAINRIRGREGVLVKQNYKKYYFENEEEYREYLERKEAGERIRSQKNEEYERGLVRNGGLDWVRGRVLEWGGVFDFKGFQGLVGLNLIKTTFTHHNPKIPPNS